MEKDKLWNANYLRAWGANFMLFFSFMLVVPLLPIYLQEEFGASKDVIGVVLSGYTAVAMLTRATSGYVVDTFPRKQILVLGFVLLTAFYVGYIVAGSLLMFAIVRTVHGFPFGIATVSNSTVAIDVLPSSRRAEGIGYYGLSNNVATAISPTVGLWLYETYHDFDILFCASLFFGLLGVWCVATIKTEEKRPGFKRTSEEVDASPDHSRNVANNSSLFEPSPKGSSSRQEHKNALSNGCEDLTPNSSLKKPLLGLDRFFLTAGWSQGLTIVSFSFAYGVTSTYVAIYGREELGLTSGSGIFFAILASGLFLSRLVGSRTLKQGRILYNASIGTCISCVGYLLFAMLHNVWGFYGCALLVGLGNGHLWPAFQNMFVNLAPANKRGTANASLLTSWDLGVGLGVLIGGYLAENYNYHAAFWCSWIIEVLGVIFYFTHVRESYERHKLR